MSTHDEKRVEQWSRIRERGIWRFILWCLLAFGVPFAALFSTMDFVLDDQSFAIRPFLMRLLVGGFVFGALTWHWNERKFRNHRSTNV